MNLVYGYNKLKTKYLNYYNQIRKKIDILNLKFDIYVFQEIGGFVYI